MPHCTVHDIPSRFNTRSSVVNIEVVFDGFVVSRFQNARCLNWKRHPEDGQSICMNLWVMMVVYMLRKGITKNAGSAKFRRQVPGTEIPCRGILSERFFKLLFY